MTIKFIKGKLCIIKKIDYLNKYQTLIIPIITYLQYELGVICVRLGNYLMHNFKGTLV